MSSANPIDDLRERVAQHGYHVFLRPDRPCGWWVTIRDGDVAIKAPVEAQAGTRNEAVLLADRLFTSHRLAELDHLIRAAGKMPPPWTEAGQKERLDTLAAFARSLAIA